MLPLISYCAFELTPAPNARKLPLVVLGLVSERVLGKFMITENESPVVPRAPPPEVITP